MVYVDLMDKYYGKFEHTILTDDKSNISAPNRNYFIYENSDPFYDVWLRTFEKYTSEYFLYMQDDFFIYNPIDRKTLNFYYEIMKENKEISCIRLFKSGIKSNSRVDNVPTLYNVDYATDYAFSMQPTIWRTEAFEKIQNTKLHISPWDEGKMTGDVLSSLGINSLYHYDNEPKRGMNHYDSKVFPYIATALIRGKWNTKEYPEELNKILIEYGINKSIRGEYI